MASLPSLSITTTTTTTLRKLDKYLSFHRIPPTSVEPTDASSDSIDPSIYPPLLRQCAEAKSISSADTVHAHILKTGTQADIFVSTNVINSYMNCGASCNGQKVFDVMPQRNSFTWAALISGYIRNDQAYNGVLVFIQLRESGWNQPTSFDLVPVLNASSALQSIELGMQLHGYLIKHRLETAVGSSLCSMYSNCRRLEYALKAFCLIPDKNVISWTTIISACRDNGRPELGLKIFYEMLLEDEVPNEFTLTSTMSLCTETRSFALGKQVHAFCVKYGCDSNVPMNNSIMFFYIKSGETEEAMRLFDRLEAPSLITWNAMIAGHAQLINSAKKDSFSHKSGMKALKMFVMIRRSGMKPDLFTFSSILSVCSDLAALEQGEQIHAQAIKTGFLSDLVVSSALVTMYNKCGFIEKAAKGFVEMSTRTLISWTSMITAYSQHGRSIDALQLFEDMRSAGVRPNKITFVGVLSACSHAGMVHEAENYFKMMRKEYGIEPVMDHYACMVDMFVRLGQMEEAFEFVKRTGFVPNEIIWSILIAGSRTHGRMDLCYYASERLLEQKPKEIETYILLLNMYLSAGRWLDVSKVRKMMKQEEVGSIRDQSRIIIRDREYSFRADDKSHSTSSEMIGLLEDLLEKARGMGYVPYKNVGDSRGETKKMNKKRISSSTSTVHHSERLAVAFGLLNLPTEAAVRVVKNITMCRDCHGAMKYFSILTRREIVVRDSKRLHRFSDGRCSCGDFGAWL